MRFDYATRDESKVERAKETLRQTAERAGHSIVGSHVFKTDSYPALQASPSAKGVAHWIIYGFTTQAELDQVKQAEESAE